jgi:hypothetical protein
VASKDIWFRPAQFANGPDGNLYIIDVYREVIEHPLSLPPEIKKHLDLTSGRDRGRIYRVVADGVKRRKTPDLSKATAGELVAMLEHANGWHRDTASRLLFARQDKSAVLALKKLAAESREPLGRMHALYALDGLAALDVDTLLPALSDPVGHVRVHAVRLAEKLAKQVAAVRSKLLAMAGDEDMLVRYQLALRWGNCGRRRSAARRWRS